MRCLGEMVKWFEKQVVIKPGLRGFINFGEQFGLF